MVAARCWSRSDSAEISDSAAGSNSGLGSGLAISTTSRWASPSPAEFSIGQNARELQVMLHRLGRLALLAGAISVPRIATGQVDGLPVRNAGVGTGIGIAADVGFPNADMGKGTAFGATGFVGLGPLGVTASVSRWNPAGDGDALTSVGATLNLKVFGGPLIPLSLTMQ